MSIPYINRDWVKATIDGVRENIGRNVIFYTASQSACPLCLADDLYDALEDVSFNALCPTCKGTYWIDTAIPNEVLARVHWVNDEAIVATPGGKYYIGEATLHIDPEYLTLAETCQSESGKVVVDGHDMYISKIIPLGAPSINRIRIILKNFGDRPNT